MPVSTGALGEPRAKRCKLCDESNHRSEPGSGFWHLQLDRDLVETISAIYPEWFQGSMSEGGSTSTPRESPPKAVIDTSPLHIDQNKESLKVKLMLRRPFDQLVAQGIMPPHKTPAAFHGQRRQLERAKTGDMLKAKIQQRPPRQELERRHILEADPGHVDPSLAERQRMLKKARLADQLNDQLSHRPGPLELIQKNILHTEAPIEQAVKTGQIPYRATSEGQLSRPQHPLAYVTPEDDSQSSEGDLVSPAPAETAESVVEKSIEGPGIVCLVKDSELVFADLCRPFAASPLGSSASTLSPLSSVASPQSVLSRPAQSPKSDAPGKDKNRKKSKSKSAPKARTIKFHEYKGPPSAQKNSNANLNNGESSYDLLLQQQTLLLQFQLQLQHKYPQIILPAQKTDSVPAAQSDSRITTRLEDMKVSDLKAELKRRSLPVSGSKPQLIERLKPFTDPIEADSSCSPQEVKDESDMEVGNPSSPLPQAQIQEQFGQIKQQIQQENNQRTQEDIVREQQRQIEELQRELTLSKLRLQEATRAEPKAQLLALQKHLQARQQQQIALQMQALQARQNELQQVALQNQKNVGLVLNGGEALVLAKVIKPEFVDIECLKPPPVYEEATKQKKSNVKSQIVDDVLEILIKNGELPPSAANDPATPVKVENPPTFAQNSENGLGLDATEVLDSLDNLDNMDFTQFVMEMGQNGGTNDVAVPMDTDDWLESLCVENSAPLATQESDLYDPLLGINQDPFDPFNLDEFQSPSELTASLSWDKVDFAA